MNPHTLGPLQLRIMSILWNQFNGIACTVHQVHDAINADEHHPKLAYTTILSVMRNLCRFEYIVKSGSTGHAHQFTVLESRTAYIHRAVSHACDDLFDGDYDAFAREVRALGVGS